MIIILVRLCTLGFAQSSTVSFSMELLKLIRLSNSSGLPKLMPDCLE